MIKEPIDFSCKHDILIRHADGTLTPMDEPYYESKEIAEGVWQIMSSGDYHYLVVGDEEGISIDTGYGAGNLREYLESLCGKPVIKCINTHYHFDHSANNSYFDTVYMASEDVDKATIPYPSFKGIDFPREYNVAIVGDNSIIPLKGRELETFKIGDHTPGGIATLDRKSRLLFVGDEIMAIYRKNISNTVEKLKNDMAKLLEHIDEFDYCISGSGILPKETVEIFYEASCLILEGKADDYKIEVKRGPRREEEQEGGQIIYDWQMPHPEDAPPKSKLHGNSDHITIKYRDWTITYDPTKLFVE